MHYDPHLVGLILVVALARVEGRAVEKEGESGCPSLSTT